MTEFFLVIFVAAIGAAELDFKPALLVGPLPTLKSCYALGALGINDMNVKHQDKDFRAICRDGDKTMAVLPGEQLLDMHQMVKIVEDQE